MENIQSEIINLIKKNRISSVEVADALSKSGVIEGPKPLNRGKFVVGEVQYIYGYSESNWSIHEHGENIKERCILFVDTFNFHDKAAFGDIVAKYFILYKGVEGIVVNGLLRDVHRLIKEDYPIWCTGITPLGCYNHYVSLSDDIREMAAAKRQYLEGSIMVCDDSGCTLIAKQQINQELFRKLDFIELQEDIWYYCIDTLKWSTYKTICEKAYLKERNILPEVLKQRMKEFDL
ncbi:hypothetical protein [Nostoc sp. C117]|uniref:RraA family protein n=1 Tax=Nostoc sp. C117 TaxID=3349875 RepID=UPI00370D6562